MQTGIINTKNEENNSNNIISTQPNLGNNVEEHKISSDTISIISTRKKVFLVLLNKIMVNINLPELKELSDFKNIDRDLIIKEINAKTIDNMSNELCFLFAIPSAGKKNTKKYPLNCIKSFAKQIGMNLSYKKKDINVTIDGTAY